MTTHTQKRSMQYASCGGSSTCSSMQSSRTDGGYNADCSSLSNFSDSSSLSLDAPYITRSTSVHHYGRQADSLDSRWKVNDPLEQIAEFARPQMEPSKKMLQDGEKNYSVTIATNQGPKRVHLPHDLFLPSKVAELKKITDVAGGSAVSALGNSQDTFGGSSSRDTNSSLTTSFASKSNLPLEPAVNTNGADDANLYNKKEANISRGLSQWKNLRVINPIDPRIDLSSVNLVRASTLKSPRNDTSLAKGDTEENYLAPNQQGYLKLLESCLPFFNTYTSSSERATSNGDMKAEATKKAIQIGEFMLKCLESDGTFSSLADSDVNTNRDATSMAALPRAKRKLAFQNSNSSASSDGQKFPQVNDAEAQGLEQEIIQHQEQLQHHDHHEQILQGPRIVSDSMAFSSANNGTSNGSGGSGNDTSRAHIEVGSNLPKSDSDQNCIKEDTKLGDLKEGEMHNSPPAKVKVSPQNNYHHLAVSATGGENAADTIATTSNTRLAMKKRKRMDRRREYEEVNRQLQESSESSDRFAEELFRPGCLVSLEDALSFTKTAR